MRTLRYYDQIELLPTSGRSDSGYRLYGRGDLVRLQQILFYRELDLPLLQIKALLDDPDFDPLQALSSHRQQLLARRARLNRLLDTLDRTIRGLNQEISMPLTDDQLFEGFSQDEVERYGKESRRRWADRVDEVENRLRQLSPDHWKQVKLAGEQAAEELAQLLSHDPGDPIVQQAVDKHHSWIENFYPAPAEVYLGLSRLYVEHDGFRAYYDNIKPGLAGFLSKAMTIYCQDSLS